jgi:hypothetical protein
MTVLAGPDDAESIRTIVRHLRKTARLAFAEVVLVIDTLAPHTASAVSSLEAVADVMLAAAEITKVVPLASCEPCAAHFGEVPRRLRDHRGIPLTGWVAGLEATQCDYVFHADCDILIYSEPEFCWIDCAISRIESDPTVMFVAPHPGPPSGTGAVYSDDWTPVVDAAGDYRFKVFSSRRFVVKRSRLARILPVKLQHVSVKRKLAMNLGGRSSILPWETLVDSALKVSPYWSVWLSDVRAWSLHCPEHGARWRNRLQELIARIERGEFPAEQAGRYELLLDAWMATEPRRATPQLS